MKLSEFFEKHWVVQQPDGTRKPLQLSEQEKLAMDKAEEMNVPLYIRSWKRRRGGWSYDINPDVLAALEKEGEG